MIRKIISKVKSLFKKERSYGVLTSEKISLNKKHMYCNNCDKSLENDDCIVSAPNNKGHYYIRCTCGLVNKIINNNSLVPNISEVKIAHKLFSENGHRFSSYATEFDGERIKL